MATESVPENDRGMRMLELLESLTPEQQARMIARMIEMARQTALESPQSDYEAADGHESP